MEQKKKIEFYRHTVEHVLFEPVTVSEGIELYL